MGTGLGRLAALAAACAACGAVLAGAPRAAEIGANDDTGRYTADGGTAFFERMVELGLRRTVMTVRFAPGDPAAIPDEELLDRAVPRAVAAGLTVVLTVYPYPPRELEAGISTPEAFAAWVAAVARRYPQVREFVVLNEPNQPAFLRPQFGSDGRNVSAATAGAYLAAAYDALKTVDPAIRVIGVGLSPRGNDDPHAPSNVSTSPVRFLEALGRWYRASGRTAPLMDGFDFHPYPNQATDSLWKGYRWPSAGFANLDRVKQALWDAFHGTPQPTTVDGLGLYLDEVGWQVDTTDLSGYVGAENVPVTTEADQAAIYGELVREAACDPDVAAVSVFGLDDDSLRTGFQAGLFRVDGTPRPSAAAVRQAIVDTALGCAGLPVAWRPATAVLGARAGGGTFDVATGLVRTRTPLVLSVAATADERAAVLASVVRVRTSRAQLTRLLQGTRMRAVAALGATVTPTRGVRLRVSLPAGLAPGRYVVAVRFVAEANPTRTTLVLGAPLLVR